MREMENARQKKGKVKKIFFFFGGGGGGGKF